MVEVLERLGKMEVANVWRREWGENGGKMLMLGIFKSFRVIGRVIFKNRAQDRSKIVREIS